MQTLCLLILDVCNQVETSLTEYGNPLLGNADLCPLSGGALRNLLLRLHLWEQHHLANSKLTCHQHDQTVDTDTDTECRRHTILEGTQEIVIDIIQLRVSISQLLTIHHQFETLGESGLTAVHLSKRRHLNRIVGDERRLDEGTLAELTEEFVDEFTLTHGLIYIHTLREAECTDLVLSLAIAIETGLLLDSIEDRQTTEGRLERNKHFLCEAHTPQQVLITHVEFHAGKLWVVSFVHTLVTEVLTHLVNSLETTYDEALQVELGSNTHVHVLIQGIKMGDERAG